MTTDVSREPSLPLPAAAPRSRLSSPLLVATFVGLACLLAYLSNGRTLPHPLAGDTMPARLVPFSLLGFGTPTLDPFRHAFDVHGGRIWTFEADGHILSTSPIGTTIVALPFYAVAWGWFIRNDWTEASTILVLAEEAEKPIAASIAALAVAFVYLALRNRVSPRAALATALALGLGTSMWATASQLLWQHGPVVLSISLGLFFLSRPRRTPGWVAAAGAAFGLAAACRPTAVLFLAFAGLSVLLEATSRRKAVRDAILFAAAATPPAALTLAYNLYYFHHPLGWYGYVPAPLNLFRALDGIAGLLFSPNRGLLVFTPVALLGFAGLVRAWLSPRRHLLTACLGAAAVASLVLSSSYREWGAGYSFGPRYLTDLLPVLAFAAGELVDRLTPVARRLFALLLVWSILVQLDGAFCYPASQWNSRFAGNIEKAAWDWENVELWQDFEAWRKLPGPVAPWM